ncbi:hypothetical protein L6452_01832 [Arctium lappa]|uniref:Uncharacterized protein n=1 Tax=Arctium lappa TaxID=4217 RepID=A0ACB9FI60_ARCLA|nr:hypothetical protein L6452_01832 [Arctium lappa]
MRYFGMNSLKSARGLRGLHRGLQAAGKVARAIKLEYSSGLRGIARACQQSGNPPEGYATYLAAYKPWHSPRNSLFPTISTKTQTLTLRSRLGVYDKRASGIIFQSPSHHKLRDKSEKRPLKHFPVSLKTSELLTI